MDKLEQYLDQVCRSVGGSRSMRQHIRQELREHLLDAVAQRKAAGATDEGALNGALEEFGTPEEVRSGLEATHGHRLTAVLIDKAIQWKEKTMRAKWLWLTWVHLGLVLVIVMEALFLTFTMMMILPKFRKLLHDGYIDPAVINEQGIGWMPSFLSDLAQFFGDYTTPLVFGSIVLWGLFEWRVRSENKSLMRMASLGTVATVLMAVSWLAVASIVVPFCLSVPSTGKLARLYAQQQVREVDASLRNLEGAWRKEDWDALDKHGFEAQWALAKLREEPATIPALKAGNETVTNAELRESINTAYDRIGDMRMLARARDIKQLEPRWQELRSAYEPLRAAAKWKAE